ncbi:unnamed protein product [Rotaria sp. Silwood1]|nr:unnamed protein product [Rotaria sp. Silwood1]CAF1633254.1 unnamed protein product [Rotaria sp. Silwood1]
MRNGRYLHTASVLNNGKVLVAGGRGYDENGSMGFLYSSELYDPATGIWTKMDNVNIRREEHTASVLANGKVLVAGGSFNDGYSFWGPLNSSELYDPATGDWTKTGNMNLARIGQTASVLINGKVLVAGGSVYDGYLNSSELYDSATGIWTKTGTMNLERYGHTASVLPNGKVLVAGGYGGYDGYSYWRDLSSSELYDPITGIWTKTGNMNLGRYHHTASVLANGKVLVAGGSFNDGYDHWGPLNSSELYDPATGNWTKMGKMNLARYGHTASVLTNGKVLVAGGTVFNEQGFWEILNSAELYDPSTGLWTKTDNMTAGRYYHRASVLTSGKVLVTGGLHSFSSVELYQ